MSKMKHLLTILFLRGKYVHNWKKNSFRAFVCQTQSSTHTLTIENGQTFALIAHWDQEGLFYRTLVHLLLEIDACHDG